MLLEQRAQVSIQVTAEPGEIITPNTAQSQIEYPQPHDASHILNQLARIRERLTGANLRIESDNAREAPKTEPVIVQVEPLVLKKSTHSQPSLLARLAQRAGKVLGLRTSQCSRANINEVFDRLNKPIIEAERQAQGIE